MTKDSHNITTGADIYVDRRMERKNNNIRQTVVRYCWEQPWRAWQRFAVDQTVAYLFFFFFSAYMYIVLYLTLYPPLLWNCSLVTAYGSDRCVCVYTWNLSAWLYTVNTVSCLYYSPFYFRDVFTVEGNRKPLIINVINDRQWSYPPRVYIFFFSLGRHPTRHPTASLLNNRLPFNALSSATWSNWLGNEKPKHTTWSSTNRESSFFLIIL